MLQQTQVSRVIGAYRAFIKLFPSVRSLSRAPLSKVLTQWSGLGYNRRAKYLHECAKAIVSKHKGLVPKESNDLEALPGIGHYTAGAVRAFAFNEPSICIETNIRTVFLHHFFSNSRRPVHDKEILRLVEETLDRKNPREWYFALMDYGAYLKEQGVVIHRKSASYVKQAPFEGSRRQVRGIIIRTLTRGPVLKSHLKTKSPKTNPATFDEVLNDLEEEKMIQKIKGRYQLVEKIFSSE